MTFSVGSLVSARGREWVVLPESESENDLLQDLARDPHRHIILVTATPHSGKEENFLSLLGLLQKDLADLPEGQALSKDLPGGGSVNSTVHEIINLLLRRGRVDGILFDALMGKPGFGYTRKKQVHDVAASLGFTPWMLKGKDE